MSEEKLTTEKAIKILKDLIIYPTEEEKIIATEEAKKYLAALQQKAEEGERWKEAVIDLYHYIMDLYDGRWDDEEHPFRTDIDKILETHNLSIPPSGQATEESEVDGGKSVSKT